MAIGISRIADMEICLAIDSRRRVEFQFAYFFLAVLLVCRRVWDLRSQHFADQPQGARCGQEVLTFGREIILPAVPRLRFHVEADFARAEWIDAEYP